MKKVREGYKMTELGEIPEKWEVRQIQDLIKDNIIIDVLDGNHGAIHPKSSDYVEKGIPFIMANNISNGKLDLEGCKFISKEQSKTLRKGFAIAGDILLTHKGTVGQTAIVPNTVQEYIVLTPQVTYYRVKNNNSKLYNHYLKIFFDSELFQGIIKSLSAQSTRDYIGITEQKKLNIILPLFEEQEKFSSILSSVDEQIEITNNLIEKTKELKKGLMQRLLTEGIGHSRFKDTEIGRIPEEWEVRKLGDICEFKQGFQIPRSEQITEFEEGYIRYLYITDFFSDKNKLYVKDNDKFYYISYEDITIANTGNTCGKAFRGASGVLSNNMFKIFNEKELLDNEFLWQYLNSLFYWEQLKKFFNTAGQPHVGHKNMSELRIALPNNLKEQQKISKILLSVDKKIEEYESKKEKLQELKKGLMQKLLTGRIRVKV